jgi:hypothetical protein
MALSTEYESTPLCASLRAGAARRDITPPVGIYNRMWGAATHDKAEGVHRPITATVIAFQATLDSPPMLLVSLDWCIVASASVLALIRDPLVAVAGGDESRVIVSCTHTHGVGIMTDDRAHLPGGDLIRPYMENTAKAVAAAAEEAIGISAKTSCMITWAEGRCGLAANRDMPDPAADRILCGYNPAGESDDTLLVGRITSTLTGQIVATIVNYACHPTTLAWDNKLASPDYVGAMRDTVERHTGEAPCLFLQGASGELAPSQQYIGDVSIADRHGRRLGFAVLSTLESMLPPGEKLVYSGPVESGAPLAAWKTESFNPGSEIECARIHAELPLKPLPSPEELDRKTLDSDDRVLSERLRRRIELIRGLGGSSAYRMPVWFWRMGTSIVVAQSAEPYSDFQTALRSRFKYLAVAVVNVANGANGYLHPSELADSDIYQVWQSPFGPDSLAILIDACGNQIAAMTDAAQ